MPWELVLGGVLSSLGVSGVTGVVGVSGVSGGSGWLAPAVAGAPGWVRKLGTTNGDLPYGVAIAIGALAAFPEGVLAHGILG